MVINRGIAAQLLAAVVAATDLAVVAWPGARLVTEILGAALTVGEHLEEAERDMA